MLGRGVKRKWSYLDELEAELGPGMAAVEAKKSGSLPGPLVSRLQQRQLVLSLCLKKLQQYQAGVELSLRRSVLLINTLRQIQEEMRIDDSVSPSPKVILDNMHPDSCLLRDNFMEDVTCPGCAEEVPCQEVTGPLDQQGPPTAAFSDTVSTIGYVSDLALDDIFEDIDTSMYETSDLPSAWPAGSLWPVSVSLCADGPSVGGLHSYLLDLNELDNIMEILVKS